mmetsp:Transcript_38663/g.75967  ORF Transcript_38663/g.75967 Transcript_38663/m.75967 type:complete len:262 (-) Transcript_38663:134-919(-)
METEPENQMSCGASPSTCLPLPSHQHRPLPSTHLHPSRQNRILHQLPVQTQRLPPSQSQGTHSPIWLSQCSHPPGHRAVSHATAYCHLGRSKYHAAQILPVSWRQRSEHSYESLGCCSQTPALLTAVALLLLPIARPHCDSYPLTLLVNGAMKCALPAFSSLSLSLSPQKRLFDLQVTAVMAAVMPLASLPLACWPKLLPSIFDSCVLSASFRSDVVLLHRPSLPLQGWARPVGSPLPPLKASPPVVDSRARRPHRSSAPP